MNTECINIDPLQAYTHAAPERLVAALGILPAWVSDERPALEQLRERYQFGVHEFRGGRIDESGRFCYPGDPPKAPVMRMRRTAETVYFYPGAYVAIVQDDGDVFVTCLD